MWPVQHPSAARMIVKGDQQWKVDWSSEIRTPEFDQKKEFKTALGKEKKPPGGYPQGQWHTAVCQTGCEKNLPDQVETWESRSAEALAAAKKDPCTCLPWNEVYSKHGAVCGQ